MNNKRKRNKKLPLKGKTMNNKRKRNKKLPPISTQPKVWVVCEYYDGYTTLVKCRGSRSAIGNAIHKAYTESSPATHAIVCQARKRTPSLTIQTKIKNLLIKLRLIPQSMQTPSWRLDRNKYI